MGSDVLMIGIVLILLAAVVCMWMLRMIFKKTLVFFIGSWFLGGTALIACIAFYVGARGIIHLSWAIPLSIVILFINYTTLAKWVRNPLTMLTDNLNKLASGNLTIKLSSAEKDSNYELGEMANSIENLTHKFNDVVKLTVQSSENMMNTSEGIQSSSQFLSENASNQASTIEEISTSIEEMTANIHQNTENAQAAEQISSVSAKDMQTVSELAHEAVSKMQDIAREVGIIRDIAFQTNILALNAAVEAARAGDHGKGFAVVAAEVRKLAERSKVAAEKIDTITHSGVSSITEVETSMKKLTPEIEKTARLLQEIAGSSAEQSTGADQINLAVQNINMGAQQGAASSEELASSAEELAAQSEKMHDVVSFFKI